MGDEHELVTVVIPARDEEGFIGRCLDSVTAQTHTNLQILVVDGASRDRTSAIVAERAAGDDRIELLHNPAGIIPVSLNLALAAARGRWLVRVDAHSTVPDDYVATAVAHLASGNWGGVGGRKDGVGDTDAGKAIAHAMASPFGVGNSEYHYADTPRIVDHVPFGAYPVRLARELGGWDERLRVNQDFEFDHRVREAGYQLLLDPALTIRWRCRQSVPDLFRQYRRYGRGKVRVARLHPTSVQARHLAAPALVASWGLALGLALTGRWRVAALALAPYATGVAAASVSTGRRTEDRRVARHLPGAFLAMHAGWGLGFWQGLADLLREEAEPDTPRRAAQTTVEQTPAVTRR